VAAFDSKGKETLRNALRTEHGAQGRMREVRSIETRCLGICPKKAMTAINASAPNRIMTVPRKTAADAAPNLLRASAVSAGDPST
jgi:hypothetical protein